MLAGVNLPMLVKLASVRRDANLDSAVQQAQDAGRKYINVASRLPLEMGCEVDVERLNRAPTKCFGAS